MPALAVSSTELPTSRSIATRAKLLARKLRAPMADTLICQSCLDHNVPLLTRDTDFRHFVQHAGLKLI